MDYDSLARHELMAAWTERKLLGHRRFKAEVERLNALAEDRGFTVSPSHMSQILHGKVRAGRDLSILLEDEYGVSARNWSSPPWKGTPEPRPFRS